MKIVIIFVAGIFFYECICPCFEALTNLIVLWLQAKSTTFSKVISQSNYETAKIQNKIEEESSPVSTSAIGFEYVAPEEDEEEET